MMETWPLLSISPNVNLHYFSSGWSTSLKRSPHRFLFGNISNIISLNNRHHKGQTLSCFQSEKVNMVYLDHMGFKFQLVDCSLK